MRPPVRPARRASIDAVRRKPRREREELDAPLRRAKWRSRRLGRALYGA
jgi:hypothetical protein